VQFSRDVVHAFVVPQDPFRDSLAHLPHKALHIEVLKYKADDGVREEVCCRQGKHDTGGYGDECLEEVRRILNKAKDEKKKKESGSCGDDDAEGGDVPSNYSVRVRMRQRTVSLDVIQKGVKGKRFGRWTHIPG